MNGIKKHALDEDTDMITKHTVLFIYQHNSGRSQIAEAYLQKFMGDQFRLIVPV